MAQEYIYFIAVTPYNGMVAIGQTPDCNARLEALQSVSPRMTLVDKIIVTPGMAQLADIYLDLTCHALHGEWFHVTRAQLDRIIKDYTPEPCTIAKALAIHRRGIDMQALVQAQDSMIARLQEGLGVSESVGPMPGGAEPAGATPTADVAPVGANTTADWIGSHPVIGYESLGAYHTRYMADGGHLDLLPFGALVRANRYVNVREEVEFLRRY